LKKFVHKTGILIGLLIFFTGSVCAQYITNIEIIPYNPSIGDDIEIIGTVEFTFGTPSSCPNMVGYEIIEENPIIIIDVFYDVSGIWQNLGCENIDTFFINNLSQWVEKIVLNTNTINDMISEFDTVFNFDSDTLILNLVGINEVEENNSINIYPNPANKILNLEVSKIKLIGEIRLLNLQGREVRTYKKEARRLTVSDIPNGYYFLEIQTNRGKQVGKIIIE